MKKDIAGNMLKEAGLKRTSGRKAIINILHEASRPLTQQEISERLPAGVELNYANVYRSLEAFLKAGLVHRVETGDRVWRFALCGCGSRGHCHPHFICNSCGAAECLRDIKMPGFSRRLEKGYVIQEQEYYIKGLCRECAASRG